MKALEWEPASAGTYRTPARTTCGSYAVQMGVGGSRGPTFRAQHVIGIAITEPAGPPRDTIAEAKADAEVHHEELHRQASAAAKDPTA